MIVSSGAGSMEALSAASPGTIAYGASKAGVNYLARKLHFEHERDGLGMSLPHLPTRRRI